MPKKTLLVVDDEPTFGKLVYEVAEKHGLAASITTSGEDFQSAYANDKPEIAVIDIVMPELDGFELVTWLAEQDHKCPLIFMTGKEPDYVRQAATLAKTSGLTVAGTLHKPLEAKDLTDAIERCVS